VPQAAKDMTPGIVEGLQALDGEAYRSALTEILQGFFCPSDDPARKVSTIATMTSTPKHVFLSGWMETVVRCDSVTPLQDLKAPMLYVAAESSNGDLEQIRAGAEVTVGQTIGTGHFIQAECPDQVHAMVDRFLAINGLV
jgi:pimeloyl-ACP methyl ester carboxylesterase